LPQATVVNREMVAVLTRGTMSDMEMLASHPDASYLLAITEAPAEAADGGAADGERPTAAIGVCAVDVATGQMLLGQWCVLLPGDVSLTLPCVVWEARDH
jgi:DNA mismatch repair protein MSH6